MHQILQHGHIIFLSGNADERIRISLSFFIDVPDGNPTTICIAKHHTQQPHHGRRAPRYGWLTAGWNPGKQTNLRTPIQAQVQVKPPYSRSLPPRYLQHILHTGG